MPGYWLHLGCIFWRTVRLISCELIQPQDAVSGTCNAELVPEAMLSSIGKTEVTRLEQRCVGLLASRVLRLNIRLY